MSERTNDYRKFEGHMWGPFAWNYELTHPVMPRFFKDGRMTLRWYGVAIGKVGIGFMVRRPLGDPPNE